MVLASAPSGQATSALPAHPFFQAARRVRESTLPSTSRLVLLVLLAYLDGKLGTFCPSLDRIARESGLRLRTVQIHVAQLRAAGWLEAIGVSTRYHGTTIYRLGDPDRSGAGSPEIHDLRSPYLPPDPIDLQKRERPELAKTRPTLPELREKWGLPSAQGAKTSEPSALDLIAEASAANAYRYAELPEPPKAKPGDADTLRATLAAARSLRPLATAAIAIELADIAAGAGKPVSLAAQGLRELDAEARLDAAAGAPWPAKRLLRALRPWMLGARAEGERGRRVPAPAPLDLAAARRDSTPEPPRRLSPERVAEIREAARRAALAIGEGERRAG